MDSQSNINFFGIKQAHDHRFEMFLKTQSYTADSPPTAANAPEKKPAAMAEKVIVTPTDRDILIGRGTKANDHRE